MQYIPILPVYEKVIDIVIIVQALNPNVDYGKKYCVPDASRRKLSSSAQSRRGTAGNVYYSSVPIEDSVLLIPIALTHDVVYDWIDAGIQVQQTSSYPLHLFPLNRSIAASIPGNRAGNESRKNTVPLTTSILAISFRVFNTCGWAP